MARLATLKVSLAAALLGLFTIFGVSFLKDSRIYVKADELDNIYKQIDEKKEKLESIKNELNSILASKRGIGSKLSLLRKKEEELIKLSKQVETDYKQTNAEIDARKKQIDDKQQQLLVKQTVFYMSTQGGVVFLFGADSVNELMDRLTYITAYNQSATRQIESLQHEIAQLEAYKNDLKVKKAQIQEEVLDLRKKIVEVEAEYRRLQALARQKSKVKAQLMGEIKALSEKAQRIIAAKFSSDNQDDIGISGGNNSVGTSGPASIEGSEPNYEVVIHPANPSEEAKVFYVRWPVVLRFKQRAVGFDATKYWEVKKGLNSYVAYYGQLIFRKDADVYVINKLPLEIYLYGLGEMPSSWHMEALKAQAVAARTYAYYKVLHPRKNGIYDIFDSVADQNYVGAYKILSVSGSRWKSAVDTTRGEILVSNGSPIVAYYHSISGGHTLSSDEVWFGPRSYAQAKSDRYFDPVDNVWHSYEYIGWDRPGKSRSDYIVLGEVAIKDDEFFDIVNTAIYLHRNGGGKTAQNRVACCAVRSCKSFNTRCSASQYDAQQLRDVLGSAALEARISTIESVTVIYDDNSICVPVNVRWNVDPYVNRSTSHTSDAYCSRIGRDAKYAKTLRIVGITKNGQRVTIDLPAQYFKMAYNIRSPGHNRIRGSSFALFDIQKRNGVYYVYSQSYGHRVGLSQYGANGRAIKGQNYVEILSHYYSGVSLKDMVDAQSSNAWRSGPYIRVGLTSVGSRITTVMAKHIFEVVDKDGNVVAEVNGASGEYVDLIR